MNVARGIARNESQVMSLAQDQDSAVAVHQTGLTESILVTQGVTEYAISMHVVYT
jgi:hypothetical protein